MSRIPRPPETAGDAGRKLWRSILGEYTLSGADGFLLERAVVLADEIAALEELIRASGPLIRDDAGRPVANPAAVQHRLLVNQLGRVLAALQVVGEQDGAHDEDRPQRRSGFRGHYGTLRAVD